MTAASHSPHTHTALTGALRAAGCVFADDEARLLLTASANETELVALLARRIAGEPLEQLLGWAEFCGLRIRVEPGVFVPRRRTEFLVELALAQLRPSPRPLVVDLCCGSGAVAAAVATAIPGAEVHASDIDRDAVNCARANLDPLGAKSYLGDLFSPLPATLRGRVDALLVNAPYVPSGEIHLMPSEARDHEARVALDGGADGLAVQGRVAREAAGWLSPNGVLLIETSARQESATAALVSAHGLTARIRHSRRHEATIIAGTLT